MRQYLVARIGANSIKQQKIQRNRYASTSDHVFKHTHNTTRVCRIITNQSLERNSQLRERLNNKMETIKERELFLFEMQVRWSAADRDAPAEATGEREHLRKVVADPSLDKET